MDKIKDKKSITIINKNDMNIIVDKLLITNRINTNIIELSAKEGTGKTELCNILKSMFFNNELNYNDEIYITNLRHKNLLFDTKESLLKVKESMKCYEAENY